LVDLAAGAPHRGILEDADSENERVRRMADQPVLTVREADVDETA
jgi:hypothetical protein